MLKQITSRRLRPVGLPRFWQVRYYDFPVWSAEKRVEKLRYIHRNPVHRGLVPRPEDWRWSSFLQWATGTEGELRLSARGWSAAGNNPECCRPYSRPTLPHQTREEWGNEIYDPDESWTSSQ